ncbi:MAG TPA: VTT domain-containing protein [Pyrinomonadaceae bacterium]|jgi:membrane-associated protein|nr:VTT domain-containing protein [Pyrinomonadaceae bacterium]
MDFLYELYHQVRYYLNPETIAAAGYLVILFAVFAETGLAAGFFLPGDSLLFVAGLFAADGKLNLYALLGGVFLTAVVGDAVGYLTGAKMGPRLFSRPKSLLFRPAHLQKAQAFYDKYGGKTIIIARFVPIVRTFAPIVAGAAQMPYRQFVVFNVIGGFMWTFSMILAGYFLGQVFPALREHIEIVVIVIVAISLMPPVFEYLKSRREKARAAQSGDAKV